MAIDERSPESRFRESPSGLDCAGFVARYGRVYEDSPWIAEALFASGLKPDHDRLGGLAAALRAIVEGAGQERQLMLLRAHPDLAGKLAMAGDLTRESQGEQAGAGLGACSPEEFAQFTELNTAYRRKFGFPFILAVKGLKRGDILKIFKQRVGNDASAEFRAALDQVHRIAYLRLCDLAL